jgi:hypothetical protein
LQGSRLVPLPSDAPTELTTVAYHMPVFPPGLVLLRRTVLQQAGPWDESLPRNQDYDYFVRCVRYGPLAYVPEVLIAYRRHAQQITATDQLYESTYRYIQWKMLFSPDNTPAQQRLLRHGWRVWQARRVRERWDEWVGALRTRDGRAGRLLARLLVNGVRWVRGYPRPGRW